MKYIPQRIELADGTKCVALEDYDKLATENMLEVNKICNQRDAAMDVLSNLSHYLSCGLGDENTTAKEYGARIREGINALLDPILEEKENLRKMLDLQTKIVVDLEMKLMKNKHMSPELIKITKKVDSFREVLKQHGFENLQCLWYTDGRYSSNWKDMSVAKEKPDIEESSTFWQFGFRSQNEKNKRIHLEALMPVFEDYFTFDLRFYPEVKLHDREDYSGPTAKLEVCGILEEDLTDLQKYIDYLLNLK